MSAELAREIWSELRRYVNTVDRDEAAENLVSVLIDNDIDADEIKEVFKSETDIKRALAHYLKDHEEEDQDDEEDEDWEEDDDY